VTGVAGVAADADADADDIDPLRATSTAALRVAWYAADTDPTSGPPAVCDHTMLDIGGGRIWTYGGTNDDDGWALPIPWILDTTTKPPSWHLLDNTINLLPTRSATMAAYDPSRHSIYLYGMSTLLPHMHLIYYALSRVCRWLVRKR
jgi:hypothetical protein